MRLLVDLTLHFEIRTNRLVRLFIEPYSSIIVVEACFLGVLIPCEAHYIHKNSVIRDFLDMEEFFGRNFQVKVIPQLIPEKFSKIRRESLQKRSTSNAIVNFA